jgi:hypothetical protein
VGWTDGRGGVSLSRRREGRPAACLAGAGGPRKHQAGGQRERKKERKKDLRESTRQEGSALATPARCSPAAARTGQGGADVAPQRDLGAPPHPPGSALRPQGATGRACFMRTPRHTFKVLAVLPHASLSLACPRARIEARQWLQSQAVAVALQHIGIEGGKGRVGGAASARGGARQEGLGTRLRASPRVNACTRSQSSVELRHGACRTR